jgi:hypothetical protein
VLEKQFYEDDILLQNLLELRLICHAFNNGFLAAHGWLLCADGLQAELNARRLQESSLRLAPVTNSFPTELFDSVHDANRFFCFFLVLEDLRSRSITRTRRIRQFLIPAATQRAMMVHGASFVGSGAT